MRLAQRYYILGLDLAMRAGDRRYGADILAEVSRLTVRIDDRITGFLTRTTRRLPNDNDL